MHALFAILWSTWETPSKEDYEPEPEGQRVIRQKWTVKEEMKNANAPRSKTRTIGLHVHCDRFSAETKILRRRPMSLGRGDTNCCLLGREGNMKTRYEKKTKKRRGNAGMVAGDEKTPTERSRVLTKYRIYQKNLKISAGGNRYYGPESTDSRREAWTISFVIFFAFRTISSRTLDTANEPKKAFCRMSFRFDVKRLNVWKSIQLIFFF